MEFSYDIMQGSRIPEIGEIFYPPNVNPKRWVITDVQTFPHGSNPILITILIQLIPVN